MSEQWLLEERKVTASHRVSQFFFNQHELIADSISYGVIYIWSYYSLVLTQVILFRMQCDSYITC